MIDTSKYPNLEIHTNEAWSQAWHEKRKEMIGVQMIASRQMTDKETLYVWKLEDGTVELDRDQGFDNQEDYNFDTLEEGLQVANNIKGTEEEWAALYDRSNTGIMEKFLKENRPTLCLGDNRAIIATKRLLFGEVVDVWVNGEDEVMLGKFVLGNQAEDYVSLYRFPDLKTALLAADKIDGTDASWEAISEFKI